MLASMGNRLHVTMLKVTMVFGVIFAVINYFIGTTTEVFLSLGLVPVCGLSLWLFHNGMQAISKVLAMLLIISILSMVVLLVSPEVLSPIFFIPIMMGSIIIFTGKEQKIGWWLTAFILGLLVLLLVSGWNLGPVVPRSPEKVLIDRISNILGTTLLCMLEVYFLMKVGKAIQKLLIERSERLQKSNQRLTSLVHSRESMMSILSHDLRAPLTLIVTTLDLMKPGKIPQEQLGGLVEKVSNRTKNTLLMLDSLLLWSRSHMEGTGFELEKVALGQLRKRLLGYCELLSSEKQVSYQILLPEDAELITNEAMLETIFRNLLSNAFKFTPADGKITVTGENQGQGWQFTVEDSGIGMSPESLQNLRNGISFSTEGTDREKGHGLGIQIVRDFLQKLNASTRVDSEERKGTRFVFIIPQE